jgi:hypothetical protein
MFENIVVTIAIGMFNLVLWGGILLWLLNYMMEQLEGITQFNFWEFMAVVVLAFFIGSLVS